MEKLQEVLPKTDRQWEHSYKPMTPYERAQKDADDYNAMEGNLDKSIYDCPKCKNKGQIFVVTEDHYCKGEQTYSATGAICECMKIRNSVKRMKQSGLEPIIKKSTFERYEAKEDWQVKIKSAAEKFANEVDNLEQKWFFIGGGVGSGKTHLCTAIVRKLLYKGKEAKYMLWVDDSRTLKAKVNDIDYDARLDEYRKAEVLYIDDLFKITKDKYGNEIKPTEADIRLLYEIINYRYLHRNFITIISSERFIHEIEEIDSAVGSRIYEMTEGNAYNIERSRERNYRLRSMNII